MSVDAVQTSLGNLAVHPGQDALEERNPDSRREEPRRRSGKVRKNQAGPHPVVNELGQLMGRTINITA